MTTNFYNLKNFFALVFSLFFLLLLCEQTSAAHLYQEIRTISGKVTTADSQEPVIGANIVVRGTTQGTITDVNGQFSVAANEGDVLEISFVGYRDATLTVDASTANYDIALSPSTSSLSEVVVVGSRNQNRTVTDSPVPIDVIDIAELSTQTGKVEINQILQFTAPSFNATKQSGSDGADHIDPASLRGLGPDQTLVLINGKRRHQSSLVNIFGTRGRGNSGTDLNAIPAAAIKRVEILRDGASAQYGSDAIAGVINIVLKDNSEGVTGGITYGAYSTAVGEGWEEKADDVLYNIEGKNRLDGKEKKFDGNTVKADLNFGLPLGENGGFANITTEFLSKDRTLRPGWSWRKGYGSAAIDGFNFMVNSSLPLGENTEFYAFGGRNYRDTDAYAFSRDSFESGDNRSVPSLYPNGFTPRITSIITDVSASAGIRHTTAGGWNIDFNNTYGKNNFHYYIKESNNASLGAASPTDFDAGGHALSQNVTGLNFSKYYDNMLAGINLAFGFEYRTENFNIFAGEEASYSVYDENGVAITNPALQNVATDVNGDELPGSSQGFPGYSPENEVDRGRTNVGAYLDTEVSPTEDFLIGAALRYERYSDFGETFNAKLSARYEILDGFAARGSLSTGFRAPSLAQIHYNLIFTNIVAGESVPSLLSANTSTVTKAFGIGPLKEETAVNASLGLTFSKSGFNVSADVYSIAVDDRIVLTDNFDASGLGLGVEAAQFFANGVDTRTRGLDLVLSYAHNFNAGNVLNVGLSGNFNDLEIKEIHNGDLNLYTFFGPFSQAYLKAAAPDYKFNLNVGYSTPRFNASVFVTHFSEVIIQDFQWVETPPTTEAEAEALYAVATDVYEAAFTVDLSLSYSLTQSLRLTVGANNIFNTYPTRQFDGWTDQGSFFDSVQMGSDGMYLFSRLGFNF